MSRGSRSVLAGALSGGGGYVGSRVVDHFGGQLDNWSYYLLALVAYIVVPAVLFGLVWRGQRNNPSE